MTTHREKYLASVGHCGIQLLSSSAAGIYGSPAEWPSAVWNNLRLVFHSRQPSVLLWGEEQLVFPNDQFRKYLAVRPGERVKDQCPDTIELSGKLLARSAEISETGEQELVIPTRFGSVTAIGLLNESNRIAGYFLTIADTPQYAVPLLEDQSFNTFIENMPLGILVLEGEQMLVRSVNAAYLELVQRTAGQLAGQHLYDALPEVREAVSPILSDVFQTGVPFYGYEFKVDLFRNGGLETAYFDFVYHPMRANSGEVEGIAVICYEVTKSVLAKQKLQESELNFRQLVMQSPIAMTTLRGSDFVIETANQVLLDEIWCLPAEAVIGKPIVEVFPELKTQKFPELLKEVLETGKVHREDEAPADVMVSGRMRRFYLDFEYAPLLDPEGKPDGIMATVYDVTEKVEARKQLEKAVESFRHLANTLPQLVWITDSSANFIYTNKAFQDYTGMQENTRSRDAWHELVHTEELVATIHFIDEGIQQHTAENFKHRLKDANGQYRWFLSKMVLLDEIDGVKRWVGTSMDIEYQVSFTNALEDVVISRTKELTEKNIALEKMNKELQSFAYISSHDLQEPLRKIQTFAGRISDREYENLSERGRHDFDRMRKSANRMQMLIEDLLAYSRTTVADRKLEKVHLKTILSEVEVDLQEEFTSGLIDIRLQSDCDLVVVPFQFRQLIYNLLSNSIKFVAPGTRPKIVLSCREIPQVLSNGKVLLREVTVEDNGIGFEEAYKDKIFELFQRLNPREMYEGTGIGLAIVKKIIENHQGDIQVASVPGQGTKFTIRLPHEQVR